MYFLVSSSPISHLLLGLILGVTPNILFYVEYYTLLCISSEVSHAFCVSSPVSHLLSILISYVTLFHLLLPCSNFGGWGQPLSPNACDTSDNIFITRCDTAHRTIYSAWLVRLNLKVSVIQEMNLQESTYRRDEFTRKYTSFWLSHCKRDSGDNTVGWWDT